LHRPFGFHWGGLIERRDEDICVQKESIAHSIRPC
jgi:hypothetical protein